MLQDVTRKHRTCCKILHLFWLKVAGNTDLDWWYHSAISCCIHSCFYFFQVFSCMLGNWFGKQNANLSLICTLKFKVSRMVAPGVDREGSRIRKDLWLEHLIAWAFLWPASPTKKVILEYTKTRPTRGACSNVPKRQLESISRILVGHHSHLRTKWFWSHFVLQ